MKMKILSALMVGIMAVTALPISTYAATKSLIVDGKVELIREYYVNKQGITMAQGKDLFTSLGLKSKLIYNGISGLSDTKELILKVGSTKATINGIETTLPTAPVLVDGQIMVPLRFVCDTFNTEIIIDKNGDISLDSPTKDLTFVNLDSILEPGYEKITYAKALSLAQAHNSTIDTLTENLDLLKTTRDDTELAYKSKMKYNSGDVANTLKAYDDRIAQLAALANEFPNAVNTRALAEAQGEKAAYEAMLSNYAVTTEQQDKTTVEMDKALNNIDAQKESLIDSRTLLPITTEFTLLNYISSITSTKYDIYNQKIAIQLSEENLRNIKLKNQLGIESDSKVTDVELALNDSNAQLTQLKLRLDDSQKNLNSLLGLEPNKKISITFSPTGTNFAVGNIDKYIETSIINDLDYKTAVVNLDDAKYNYKHRDTLNLDEDTTKYAVNQAERKLEDIKREIDTSLRNSINNYKALTESQKTLETSLQKAKNTYSTAVINYKVGNITYFDVKQAELNVVASQMAVQKGQYNINNLVYVLKHPNLAA